MWRCPGYPAEMAHPSNPEEHPLKALSAGFCEHMVAFFVPVYARFA